jgi:hypothetical protein
MAFQLGRRCIGTSDGILNACLPSSGIWRQETKAKYASAFIGCTLSNCTASNNAGPYGINAGPGSTLTHCAVSSSGSSFGIQAGIGSTLSNCIAALNTSFAGISADTDCTVKDCTAVNNHLDGIELGARCEITGCSSNGNGNGLQGSGIVGQIRTVVRHCSAADNRRNGIAVLGDSVVMENRASHNGLGGGSAAGIDTNTGGGSGSRVEGNHVRDNNGTGILAGTADVVIRNTAGGNTSNFSPSSGVNFGPIQSPSTATNPLANIIF